METYDISLVHKPILLVLNKTDVSDGGEVNHRVSIPLISMFRKRTFCEGRSKTPSGLSRFPRNYDHATQ